MKETPSKLSFSDCCGWIVVSILSILLLHFISSENWGGVFWMAVFLILAILAGLKNYFEMPESKRNILRMWRTPSATDKAAVRGKKEKAKNEKIGNFLDYSMKAVVIFTALILLIAIIFVVYPYVREHIGGLSLGAAGESVSIDGISFVAPKGWEVNRYPGGGVLLEVVGPDEAGSRPNFNIDREYYTSGGFESGVDETKSAIRELGGKILSESSTYVDGKFTRQYTFRFYKSEKGYYGKGEMYVIDTKYGEIVGITFASKESTYYDNLAKFEKTLKSVKFR